MTHYPQLHPHEHDDLHPIDELTWRRAYMAASMAHSTRLTTLNSTHAGPGGVAVDAVRVGLAVAQPHDAQVALDGAPGRRVTRVHETALRAARA